jgi:hypothetical protein
MLSVTLVGQCMDSILNVRIPKSLADRLEERKQKTLVPTSAWVRSLIEIALKAEEKR